MALPEGTGGKGEHMLNSFWPCLAFLYAGFDVGVEMRRRHLLCPAHFAELENLFGLHLVPLDLVGCQQKQVAQREGVAGLS